MKDIKVIFRGQKCPSGKMTNTEYYASKDRIELWKKSGLFDMEFEMPKKQEKKAPKKSKKDKGDK